MNPIVRQFSSVLFNILILALFPLIVGCSIDFSRWDYTKAEKSAERGDFKKSVSYYSRVMKRNPESDYALRSARSASRIAQFELKDFDKAIEFSRHLILFSKSSQERKLALRDVAEIYFDKKNDYPSAITEYNKLLNLNPSKEEFLEYKRRIARAHFYISEFFQAESEVKSALKVAEPGPEAFEFELFLANIYFNTKRMDEAVQEYRRLLKNYPELARQEKVDMSLVVSLEEQENFKEAIQLLREMKSTFDDPQFIDLKIARLEERIKNQPGSRGLRK
jgi:tetratricopeptide (TPR) repeat protein